MKWNVAVYLRVSKEVDDLCETNSLDNQKLIIENFVNSNKDLVIKDCYIDNVDLCQVFRHIFMDKLLIHI